MGDPDFVGVTILSVDATSGPVNSGPKVKRIRSKAVREGQKRPLATGTSTGPIVGI